MEGFEYLITGVLISVFLAFSSRMSKKEIPRGLGGKYHLRLNNLYKWAGYLSSILGFALIIALLFMDKEASTWEIILGFILFLAPGEILLLWYFNHHLIFDEETIIVTSWTGKSKEITWDSIDKIKYNRILGYLQIYSGATKLNIHYHIAGLIKFLRLMEIKTDFKAVDLKLPI